jgi:hypothetical protein
MTDTGPANGPSAALDIATRWRSSPSDPDTLQAIANLIQAYALFADHGRADEMAGLFTDDAVWDGHDLGYGVGVGPQDIARTVLAHYRPDSAIVHLPGPAMLVTESEQEISAFCWCLATRRVAEEVRPLIFFSYADVLRRQDSIWRFSRRTLRRTLPVSGPAPGLA